jgi:hypothetical protein
MRRGWLVSQSDRVPLPPEAASAQRTHHNPAGLELRQYGPASQKANTRARRHFQ